MIRRLSAPAILMAATMLSQPTFAQDVDDWEYEQDPARALSVAAVRYEGGVAIMVQCRQGGLTAALVGLPAGLDSGLELQATRADGRADVQTWAPAGAPGLFRSTNASRDVRFMRGGGVYAVRTPDGDTPAFRTTFDLPAVNANLDRVLTECGWPIADERDQLVRAGAEASLVDPAAPPPRERAARRQSRPRAQSRTVSPPPGPPVQPPAEDQISCIIREARLADCRQDHPPSAGETTGAAVATAAEVRRFDGRQVYAPDTAALEGRVFYMGGPQLIVVVDYITLAQ